MSNRIYLTNRQLELITTVFDLLEKSANAPNDKDKKVTYYRVCKILNIERTGNLKTIIKEIKKRIKNVTSGTTK